MKTIATSLFISAAIFLSAVPAYAAGTAPTATPTPIQSQCQPIYGGGQTCVQQGNLVINKTVLNPQTNQFVDNLGVNDPKFGPDFIVTFQITLTNTGNSQLSNLTLKDTFPQFVNFSSGPGTFDNNNKTVTVNVDKINAGETKTFTFIGKVVSADQLPLDQGVSCVINQAIATVNSQASQDNAQLCIEKNIPTPTPGTTKGGQKVFPGQNVTTAPNTGPEALVLFGLLPLGAAGEWLRRKSR